MLRTDVRVSGQDEPPRGATLDEPRSRARGNATQRLRPLFCGKQVRVLGIESIQADRPHVNLVAADPHRCQIFTCGERQVA